MATYYRQRYALLFSSAQQFLDKGGGGQWDDTAYCEALFAHELSWQTDASTRVPAAPTVYAIVVSKAMHAKYGA